MSASRFWLVMAALVALAAAVRLFVYCQRDYIGHADESAYTSLAQSIASGAGMSLGGEAHVHFPPGYPFAISLALRCGAGPARAGQIVSVIAGVALVLAMGLLARDLYGARVGVVAATMLVLLPDAVQRATAGMSEALFTVLLVAAYTALVRSYRAQRPLGRAVGVLSAGLLFGAGYLVRPEGLLAATLAALAVMALALSAHRGIPSASGDAALVIAGSALVALPYVLYLHSVTGAWQLTGKGAYTALGLSGGSNQPGEKAERWYGLTEDGELRAERAEEIAPSMLELFSPRQYAKRLYDTYNSTVESYTDPIFMALIGIGALASLVSPRRTALALLPVSALGLGVVLPAVHPGRRYLSPLITLLVVFAALGAVHLSERIAALRAGSGEEAQIAVPAAPWLVPIVLLVTLPWLKPSVIDWWQAPRTGEIPLEEKTAGEWIARNLAPDAILMVAEARIGYYAHRRSVTTPFAQLPAVLDYARAHGVTHLVVTERWTSSLRPKLEPLLDPANAPPELKLVHHQQTPEGWSVAADVLIYEILPGSDHAATGDATD
ncbi:MAG: ArnT family glycosyltransferase [Armatimonadota bacterium]